MSQRDTANPMNEDARMLAAATAARTERANRPTMLVLFSAVLLAGALVWLLWAWSAQRDATRSLSFQQRKSERVAERVAQLLSLRARTTSGEAVNEGNTQLSQLLPRIASAASASGIKDNVPPPAQRRLSPAGTTAKQLLLEYNVADESLPALLAWIDKSLADVPGLESYKVVVSPEQQKWRLKVTFSRWEKAEST